MTRIEERGRPTVTIVAKDFHKAFRSNARAWGQSNLAVAEVPSSVTGQPQERIKEMADGALNAVLQGLTQPWEGGPVDVTKSQASGLIAIEAKDEWEALEVINRRFIEQQWSDGFPIVPPTPQAVERMLKGTRRSPKEVIGIVEPGLGEATVEKIAVNAVMAGCKPEHLPVLIAAVRAGTRPEFFMREMQVSTPPECPLLLINGPIRTKLGFNSGTCALGPGAVSHVNSVIGRAFRLTLMNVGECYPGIGDINTMGSPGKYSMCVAENEEASPWEPYHVEQGFDRDASTVTIAATVGYDTLVELDNARAEPTLDRACRMLQYGGAFPTYAATRMIKTHPVTGLKVETQHTLLLAPDNAHAISGSGWSKQDAKRYVYEHARLPQRLVDTYGVPKRDKAASSQATDPEALVPVIASPDALIIAVVGGTGHISQFLWGCYKASTQKIEE